MAPIVSGVPRNWNRTEKGKKPFLKENNDLKKEPMMLVLIHRFNTSNHGASKFSDKFVLASTKNNSVINVLASTWVRLPGGTQSNLIV